MKRPPEQHVRFEEGACAMGTRGWHVREHDIKRFSTVYSIDGYAKTMSGSHLLVPLWAGNEDERIEIKMDRTHVHLFIGTSHRIRNVDLTIVYDETDEDFAARQRWGLAMVEQALREREGE